MALTPAKPTISLESIVAEAALNLHEVRIGALPKLYGHLAVQQELFPATAYRTPALGKDWLAQGDLEAVYPDGLTAFDFADHEPSHRPVRRLSAVPDLAETEEYPLMADAA